MKTLFVKRSRAWLAVLFTGIVLVGAGLWQAPREIGAVKGAGGTGASAEDIQISPQVTPQKAPDNEVVTKDLDSRKGTNTQSAKSIKQNEFFVEYRLERDRTRSQQVDLLREIVNNQNSPEETRKEAQRRVLAITQAMETEMKLENLIKAENFKDSVVFVQDKGVTVIVETPVLTPVDKDRLTGIAVRATGLSKDNVVIIAKV